MTKDELKQIGDLLDGKLEKALELNNEQLLVKFDEKLEKAFEKNNEYLIEKITTEIGEVVGSAFAEFEGKVKEKFAKIDEQFATVGERFNQIGDELTFIKDEVRGVKHDSTLLKYFHIKELKSAPDSLTVISKLSDEGL